MKFEWNLGIRGDINMNLKQKIEQAKKKTRPLMPLIPMDTPIKPSTEERLTLIEDALLESLVNEDGS